MAIQSIDSYLLREIKPRLKTVLENCYIIDEVLKDFDEQSRDAFKSAFCGKNAPNEVTVGFNFPEMKTNHVAHYLIQLGQGEEDRGSIGNVQGTYVGNNGNTLIEKSTAVRRDNRLVFTVSKDIHELVQVNDMEFAVYDKLDINGNEISFRYESNEDFENYNAEIVYVESTGSNKGMVKGITVTEQVTIIGLSHNIDVARCLDAVLKMILIAMREGITEQNSLQLQTLSFGDMAPIIDEADKMIFGRPVIIQYKTSMDMDYNVTKEINRLTFKERKDWRVDE